MPDADGLPLRAGDRVSLLPGGAWKGSDPPPGPATIVCLDEVAGCVELRFADGSFGATFSRELRKIP